LEPGRHAQRRAVARTLPRRARAAQGATGNQYRAHLAAHRQRQVRPQAVATHGTLGTAGGRRLTGAAGVARYLETVLTQGVSTCVLAIKSGTRPWTSTGRRLPCGSG